MIVENYDIEPKPKNKLKLLNCQPSLIEEALNVEANSTQSQLNQNFHNELLNPEELRVKTSVLLSKANSPEIENDFRRTCTQYQKNPDPSPALNEAYQEYTKTYYKITSLYLSNWVKSRIDLIAYDTENEREEVRNVVANKLDFSTCITQLPNGDLFCFSNKYATGAALIIDKNYQVQEKPSGELCIFPTSIYFKNSVYCFGGWDQNDNLSDFSNRFSLDRNQWIKLASMPQADIHCHCVEFKGNILVSGCCNSNILLYSIDIESFSTVSYNFSIGKIKIFMSSEERLYLIESRNGSIYESEVGDVHTWKVIGNSIIDFNPNQIYCKYNKGGIYILAASYHEKLKLFWNWHALKHFGGLFR